jgi:prolycopene isomerase
MTPDYDVIIIGAGIGGLSAAALLANQGFHVLVVDQHSKPGGYCSTFRRGQFVFDVAVHLIGGCEAGGLVDEVLRSVRVRDKIEFKRVAPMYVALRGNDRIPIPSDLHELAAVISDYAPAERGVGRVVDEIYDIGSALLGFAERPTPEKSFRALARVANQSYLNFISRYVTDERALALLSGLAIYAGLPPSQMDAGLMISILISYHRGAFYPMGSSQSLANAFVDSIEAAGGTVKLRSRVTGVLMEEDRACGIELAKAGKITARAIISNADCVQTLFDLVGERYLPENFIRRFRRLRPAVSAVNLYLALNRNPGLYDHEMFTLSEQHPRDWQLFFRPNNKQEPFASITMPSLLDPSLAPEGGHVMAVNTFTDCPDLVETFRNERGKQSIRDELFSIVERVLPDIRSCLVEQRCEVATPRTLVRYTANKQGSALGWGKYWDQHWPYRLGPATPIAGLYMAGHWTRGTHGIYGVIKSGKDAAAYVQKELAN